MRRLARRCSATIRSRTPKPRFEKRSSSIQRRPTRSPVWPTCSAAKGTTAPLKRRRQRRSNSIPIRLAPTRCAAESTWRAGAHPGAGRSHDRNRPRLDRRRGPARPRADSAQAEQPHQCRDLLPTGAVSRSFARAGVSGARRDPREPGRSHPRRAIRSRKPPSGCPTRDARNICWESSTNKARIWNVRSRRIAAPRSSIRTSPRRTTGAEGFFASSRRMRQGLWQSRKSRGAEPGQRRRAHRPRRRAL